MLDPDELRRCHSLLPKYIPRYLDNFLQQAPQLMAAAETALETDDFSLLQESTHELKNATKDAGAVGCLLGAVVELAELCDSTDHAALRADFEFIRQLVTEIRTHYNAVAPDARRLITEFE